MRRLRASLSSLAAALRLCVVKLLLRLLGVQRTLRLVQGWAHRPGGETPVNMAEANRLAGRVLRFADRIPLGLTCLPRSTALAWVFWRRGLPADIVTGVAETDRFQSHAWVETPLGHFGEGADGVDRFAEIWRFGTFQGKGEPHVG
jgi:hypothetical protein